jgi:hypothetical protein
VRSSGGSALRRRTEREAGSNSIATAVGNVSLRVVGGVVMLYFVTTTKQGSDAVTVVEFGVGW